ncbi:MAG: KdsC family phosphatase [Limisphaerales bacterium]
MKKGAELLMEAGSRRAKALRGQDLDQRLKRVRLFLCDVDGILTDAGVYMGPEVETKRFNIRDGLGLRLMQRQGIQVGWVSNRASIATTRRAEDLKVDFLHQAPGSKVAAIEAILRQTGFTWEQTCFMGDDIVDLGALRRAGLAVTVANGIDEVKALSHHVTTAPAGHGAVREVAEMILKAQEKWAALIEEYSA